ncbi:DNA methylase [Mucilaginibacter sp. SMC90]|uniref:helicase-related protein n=1 Tax=Mucilaginibacter sp. SMC90 TaxID=2929803 RepID=UPI001FB45E25|nr:helicase-related protein [Mucilaginibacter sp. SMC90]UOE47818.1 DNA methylase [Mucilaginibacter sp. SMC90]
MAFNTAQRLAANIAAIRIALDFSGGQLSSGEVEALSMYAGFGGLKVILNKPGTIEEWKKNGVSDADLKLYPQVMELHRLLQDKLSPKEYRQVFDSLRNSRLTAFYTPGFVPEMIYAAFRENNAAPRKIYEPSAGAGIFITKGFEAFPGAAINAVEKDILTGKVLKAYCAGLGIPAEIQVMALEETDAAEKGQSDLVISNIPFGKFSVYDPAYLGSPVASKIHTYFFAKGLDKLADGGILAYLVTDAFLNNPSNSSARKFLVTNADLLSVAVLPANLMKENANVEVGTHLIVVQKNTGKTRLRDADVQLMETTERKNDHGTYHINSYIDAQENIILGDELLEGTNAYGEPNLTVWYNGEMPDIAPFLKKIISEGIGRNFDIKKWQAIAFEQEKKPQGRKLTFLELPAEVKGKSTGQLGLFDVAAETNRALSYLKDIDKAVIDPGTAKQISTIRTTDQLTHDSVVMLTARARSNNRYLYKLFSNVKELSFSNRWHNGQALGNELEILAAKLKYYAHDYRYEGDTSFEPAFKLQPDRPKAFTEIRPYYTKDTLVVFNGRVGLISEPQKFEAEFEPLEIQEDIAFYHEYILLRDTYLQLSGYEAEHLVQYPDLRRELNDAYGNIVARYGELNKTANRARILNDAAFGFKILSSLEVRQEGAFVRSDIFYGPVFSSKDLLQTEDPAEALAICLNELGKVDLRFIAETTGLEEPEIILQLDKQLLYNPGPGVWETADNYLSGNVVDKLKIAESLLLPEPDNLQIARSLAAIRRVQPEVIPFELLDFNLGERWVPVDLYRRFASSLFKTETDVNYFSSVDTFKVNIKKGDPTVTDEFVVVPKSGNRILAGTLLEHALENTSPQITYPLQQGDRVVRMADNEAMQAAHRKIENIRQRYIDWLKALEFAEKKEIQQLYNEKFNCFVLREFDGSHLKFPGLDKKALGIESLYSSQENAAWRIIQNRGGLIDHEVGLGKTLTMIVAAMEMRRLGVINKPMILALKANIGDITNTFRKAYPKAKILAPGENDFTPAKRLRLFHEIKNNNWDCIILTHDQFGMIPQSPEIQKEILNIELGNVELDLETLKELGAEVSQSMLKGLEIRKQNLEVKLNAVLYAIENKKDNGINFQEMNVDHLFVDESHKFKNLTFTTRHTRVAGLGNMAGSQKSLNMLFAVRTLQEKFDADLCVTFLSGTPISNSLTEMYLIFKYLRPRELERQGISNFDAWAAVYARKTVDFEFTVTNEIRAKERFRHFIKVPELALFYNEITDYKTAKHINLDKPEIDEKLVNIPPTPEQSEFIEKLMAFAKTGNGSLIGRRPLTREEDMGRMLIATNYAKKMAVDLRLVDEEHYSDHPGNKVNVCCRNVARIYGEGQESRGTQIIFCDIGTPRPGGFNVYDALLEKLVNDFKIPRKEITFIHNWTSKQKPELFRLMNAGMIRVLIGSTEKAGTGLNVQARGLAMHHLDIPWKPSELEQRNGRMGRQGNWLAKQSFGNKVRVFIYAVEKSLDNYKFNLLKNKQTFISQMKNNELTVRTLDEGVMDEQSGMNFSEYIAILSGDTSLLEKAKLEKKVAVLESARSAHYKEVSRSRIYLEDLEKEKIGTGQTLELMLKDQATYKRVLKYDEDGSKINMIRLDDFASADPAEIGNHLIGLYLRWHPESYDKPEKRIGDLYGFDLYVRRKLHGLEDKSEKFGYATTLYAESRETGIKYMFNNGAPNIDNPKYSARYFLNAIDRVMPLAEKYGKRMLEIEDKLPRLRDFSQKVFEQETDLVALKIELEKLETEINKNIADKQKTEGGPGQEEDQYNPLKPGPDSPDDTKQMVYSGRKR